MDDDRQAAALELVREKLRERDAAERNLKHKASELADAMVDARTVGVTVADLQQAAHLSRAGVYHVLHQHNYEPGESEGTT